MLFIQYSTSVKVVTDEEEPMALIYDIGNLKDLSRLVLFDEEMWKFWRSYEIKNYFCVRQKNERKHNQHFKLLF